MNTKQRLAALSIAAFAAAAAITACSTPDPESSTPNLADTIAATCDELGQMTPSVYMDAVITATRGLEETDEQKSRAACDNYRSGTQLTQLRSLPVTWDQQCLEGPDGLSRRTRLPSSSTEPPATTTRPRSRTALLPS